MIPILDEYRIVDQLGRSIKRKFNQVYLIERKSDKQNFILKYSENQFGSDRLEIEAQFNFPKIDGLPNVIDFWKSKDQTFLILDFIPGITAIDYATKLKRKERFSFIRQLTNKLVPIFNELEVQKIIHADIKPENILVQQTGTDFKIHLIDFGMAFYHPFIDERKLIFPLGFAAPELILNRLQLANHSTDLFAYGITLWNLMELRLPLSHPNPSIYTNLQLVHPLSDTVSKEFCGLLNKLSVKPNFPTSPNRMNQKEVDYLLNQAISKRFTSLKKFDEALNQIRFKRRLFF